MAKCGAVLHIYSQVPLHLENALHGLFGMLPVLSRHQGVVTVRPGLHDDRQGSDIAAPGVLKQPLQRVHHVCAYPPVHAYYVHFDYPLKIVLGRLVWGVIVFLSRGGNPC